MIALFRKLVSLLSPRERLQFATVLAGIIVSVGLEAAGLGLLLAFIMVLRDGVAVSNPLIARGLGLVGLSLGPESLPRFGTLVLAFYVAKNLYIGWLYRVQFTLVYAKQTDLSKRLLRTYLDRSYVYHLQRNTAEMLKNITDEVHAACHNVLVPLLILISEVLLMVVIVGTLMVVDFVVTLSVLGIAGVLAWGGITRVHQTVRHHGEVKQQHLEAMIKWVNQSFGSLKEIKILGCERWFVDVYGRSASGFGDSLRFVANAHQLPRLVIEVLAVGFITLTVVIAQWEQRSAESIMPILALFGLAAVRLMPSVGRAASMLTMIKYFEPAVDIVIRDIGDAAVPGDRASAPAKAPVARAAILRLRDRLVLTGVSYHYPGAESAALTGVSLSIRKGTMVGFVGPSGSGKTTLVDLILGLLVPREGQILVDGRSIYDDLRGWQANIGYIPQNPYLLDDSIRRNVALGLADDDIDDDQVWAALRSAQLESFVLSLPEQLSAVVGERGSRISGGERQRLGIARALYHEPDVLIMDEPTASLDYATEHEVIKAIEALRGERKTIIVVAHRLSTVRACDDIYRVTDGVLVGPVEYASIAALAQVGEGRP